MAELVSVTTQDDIAILTLWDPPSNTLTGAMRRALWQALDDVPATTAAIVLMGAGKVFCGGVGLEELAPQKGMPDFDDLMDRVEQSDRPIIAAIHGRATGGGLELALACHYRVTATGSKLGLPQVTLGFSPGGGATQRLPRLIGVENALRMMLTGALMSDSRALAQGLIDARTTGTLSRFAVAFAKDVISEAPVPRRVCEMRDHLLDGAGNQKVIAEYREVIEDTPLTAPKQIVDCVEAALLLPFEAGIAYEQSAFEDGVASEQSKALRYLAAAEGKARRMPEARGLAANPVTGVALIGQGKRAFDLAIALIQAGLDVTLTGPPQSRMPDHVSTWLRNAVETGRLNADQAQRAQARLKGPVPVSALEGFDLVIDAAPDAAQPFGGVPGGAGRILAAARGSIDLAKVPNATHAIGLGFGIPVTDSNLLTLNKGPGTTNQTIYDLAHLAFRLNRQAVICNDARMDLAGWMLGIWRMAAETCLRDGATPYQVDAAMRALGCNRGPYQLLDLAGLSSMSARMPPRRAPRQPLPGLMEALREAGQSGRSAREGVYLYDDAHPNGREDSAIVELTIQLRRSKGLPERQISDRAIQRRCLIALANEAARLRTEAMVRHASDLDVVLHHGLGFPRWRGGPVVMADQSGLLAMQRDLKRLADHDPYIWEPAPLLGELIKNGKALSEV